MHTPPTILASRERKIDRMIIETGCSRDEAIAYRYAEEWFVPDAVLSYTIDQQLKQESKNV